MTGKFRAQRLMLRILGFNDAFPAGSMARARAAEELIAALDGALGDRGLAIVDLDQYHLLPKGAWIYFSHSRMSQVCLLCGEKTPIGKPIYWRNDESRVALCGRCGDGSEEVQHNLQRAAPTSTLFEVGEER